MMVNTARFSRRHLLPAIDHVVPQMGLEGPNPFLS
jgi:hypothetical protein